MRVACDERAHEGVHVNTDTKASPPRPATKPKDEPAVKHVVRTGLPPGISVEDAKDPGSTPPKGRVDNRS